jgi:Flp pilus assembly pilin Flp
MSFTTRSLRNNNGHALVKCTLFVLLVALVFWVGIWNDVGAALTDSWNKITACIEDVVSCSSAY